MSCEYIMSDAVNIIPDADMYRFGVLTSRVHMAWTRRVCGRIRMDYRYSVRVVYNPYVWPCVNDGVRGEIEGCARGILDARAMYPECTYAELYNDLVMPPELRTAHARNDEAVCRAYGFDAGMTEEEIAGALLEMYEAIAGTGAKLKARKRREI